MFSSGVLISIIFAVTHSEIKGIGFDLNRLHACMCCVLNSYMAIGLVSRIAFMLTV